MTPTVERIARAFDDIAWQSLDHPTAEDIEFAVALRARREESIRLAEIVVGLLPDLITEARATSNRAKPHEDRYLGRFAKCLLANEFTPDDEADESESALRVGLRNGQILDSVTFWGFEYGEAIARFHDLKNKGRRIFVDALTIESVSPIDANA